MARSSVVLALSAAVLLGGSVGRARGEAWPTYQHDIARSGVSGETLSLPLQPHWVHTPPAEPRPAWADPQPVPVEGVLEPPRVKFDDTFHVVSADGAVYYASSAENLVCALDAATGKVRWRFFTGGPVRLAPTLSNGWVYFGSDDGCVYCLRASDGSVVWQRRVGPTGERVLGHGRMVSLWPVRSGVLVDSGVAYYTAGVFPAERVYVCAARADDGTPLWTNDTVDDASAGQGGFSPQGYPLASAASLYIPSGRALPACFDRKDGRFLYQRSDGRWNFGVVGGAYALLAGEQLFGGTGQVIGYEQTTGVGGFAWFPGRRLIVTADTSYMLDDSGITALDRTAYPAASRRLVSLQAKRKALNSAKPADLKDQLAALDEQDKQAAADIAACTRWRYEQQKLEGLIVAGDVLLAGGEGEVLALRRRTGGRLWSGSLEGAAKGLAVADGRLFVSTDRGAVYCFAPGEPPAAAPAARPSPEPFPRDELTPLFEKAAESLLNASGVRRGYCLVLGGSGRLAYELAQRSQLTLYSLEADETKVRAGREALTAAGLYGTRITLDQAPDGPLPYSDYFANMVVSEEALLTGRLPASAEEVLRVLKPCGGVVCLGRPGQATEPLTSRALRAWFRSAGMKDARVDTADGVWGTAARGPLPGAGQWTHQYGDPGNTASSEDTVVKAPLGVLWYGEPGPNKVPSRHAGNAAPLTINGRVYLQGINRIMCFDAYNGVPYWERELPGAYRVGMVYDCSNLACDAGSLFVATGAKCLRLDAETGRTLRIYKPPHAPDDRARQWAYVAVVGDLLFGGTSVEGQFSDCVFARSVSSGKLRWAVRGGRIRNNTIAISEGRLFFADAKVTPAQRQEALRAKIRELMDTKQLTAAQAEKRLTSADVRLVTAVDTATGKKLWERPVDLTDCGPQVLMAIATRGVLLFCGAHSDGHMWPQFLGGEYAARRATALSAQDGSPLWSKAIGYRIRPLVIGDTLVAEPWAFDLRSGEQKLRPHPVTGLEAPWQFERPGHHCGCISGSPNGLFFRSWSLAYYDLLSDNGTEHFGGQRPGCWINMIPANGLLVMPEASSGCICLISIHCTTVFRPRQTDKAWGLMSAPGPVTPVQELRLNLGAPGDRRDSAGKLWLAYPRPFGRMPVAVKLDTVVGPEGGYFSEAAETSRCEGAETPWLYASGCVGLRSCVLPMVGPADGPALYTVRLGFADGANTQPGQRVFDVRLQGRTVAEGLDVVREAGGPGRAVVREFAGIPVDRDLKLELVPRAAKPNKGEAPVLNWLELRRERVLHVGIAAPSFTVSDVQPQSAGEVEMANRTGAEFLGTLRLSAPDGLGVLPAEAPVKLAAGQRLTVPLQVWVTRKGPAANREVSLQLLRGDGTMEVERHAPVEYLGPRGRVVIPTAADTYVNNGNPATNYGHGASLLVDGGQARMGDEGHALAYLRFPLRVPGRIVSVRLRLHTSPSEAAESNDSGRIYLVDQPWDENALTYANRPPLGIEVGRLGAVARNVWEERPLTADWTGRTELNLVIEPTSTDGASYVAREGDQAPELVVEFEQ